MTKPAATEMLRFRTTGKAENGEGGDLQKPLLAVLRFNPWRPPGAGENLDQPHEELCTYQKIVKSFFLAVLTVQL
jgi:hypothetical protein